MVKHQKWANDKKNKIQKNLALNLHRFCLLGLMIAVSFKH